jgi:hypothetical protein
MKKNLILLGLICFLGCSNPTSTSLQSPNIVYILADDLGYGELGAYGQEKIKTPNLASQYPEKIQQLDSLQKLAHRHPHIREWEFIDPKFKK